MTAGDHSELDALRVRCAELEARLAARPGGADPETAENGNPGPGRNALFSAMQLTRMPMILTDPHQPDNPIIYANRAFTEMSGYASEELIGRNCRFLQGKDTSPEVLASVRHAINTRSRVATDIVNYRKDGRRFVNELYISPVFDSDGGLLYFFGSQVDVTAHTQARLTLQLDLIERERHVLGRIAAGIPLLEVLEELLHVVEAQNGHGMRTSILFLSEDGRHLRHAAAPSLPAAYIEAIDGIAIGEGVGSCGTVATRGSPVYVSDIANDPLWLDFRDLALFHGLRACWSTPIKATDGAMLGTFAIYYDVPRSPTEEEIAAIGFVTQTAALAIERHRHDLVLRHSRAALEALNADLERQVVDRSVERGRTWQVSPDLLSVIDLETGLFERVNPAWTATLGHATADMEGQPYAKLLHPEDVEASHLAFEQVRRGEPVLDLENRYRSGSGRYHILSWAAVPAGTKLYSRARDVTAERRQQRELAIAQDALRQSQRMEAVGQLTGGVAHDFNNLLTVIGSSAELLKRPGLPEQRRARYVSAISDTVERAAKLTGQLLAFARRQALKPEIFAACDSIRTIGDMMATLAGSRVRITTHLPEQQCFVNADHSQFDTALVNLVANARDAMVGEGHLTVIVRSVEGMPALRSSPAVAGSFVAVSIADTGSGIPPDQLEQVFEPFFTTKETGKGTGLGLSQVFGFVKQSGGDVAVTSEVGVGTTFTLYLPRVGQGAQPAVAEQPETMVDGHGTGVLLVEDNEGVGASTRDALNELGYRTVLVASAKEALDALGHDAHRFEVVFSDVVMPGMSGIELAQRIRDAHHDLPVVLTSGYSHVLAQNGTFGFELLHKPYSIEQLSRTLHKAAAWQRRHRSPSP